ncbi:cytochrome c oxidase subunit 5b-1, mitochondrial isoform X2 [Capsicum annuum]|uniref:cytochrome c oxidase subunit 5b-1, mitochondrial isoform X2 n=1 Tax=Capsicum annuum TaxID=4072 RepID=UPI0007BFAEB9|nr:cytochrome c oxidase subunit 5b-1, mitochondrial isoform X2 [Capsicum annuum]
MSRKLSSHRRILSLLRSTPKTTSSFAAAATTSISSSYSSPSPSPAAFRSPVTFFPHHFSTVSENVVKKVEDVMPIATGHEREELEAELQEAPAIVKSYFDRRIVGCPGDEGEDEHDVVWFWLEKGKPHECPVCSQYFELEVVGPGGPPDGHGSDDEGHH